MEKKNPIEEAQRYIDNAKSILIEHGEFDAKTKTYGDRKYVKMAGNTLWNGVLVVLDAAFNIKRDKRTRPDINDYRNAIGERNRKLLTFVNSGYSTMHLAMGYDGNQSKKVCDGGFECAANIVELCKPMLNS